MGCDAIEWSMVRCGILRLARRPGGGWDYRMGWIYADSGLIFSFFSPPPVERETARYILPFYSLPPGVVDCKLFAN